MVTELDKSMQQVISKLEVLAVIWLLACCDFSFLEVPLRLPSNVHAANLSPCLEITSRLGPQKVTEYIQSSVTNPLIRSEELSFERRCD